MLGHPTQVNTPHVNHCHTGWYSIYIPRRDGRLSRPCCLLYTEMVYLCLCTYSSWAEVEPSAGLHRRIAGFFRSVFCVQVHAGWPGSHFGDDKPYAWHEKDTTLGPLQGLPSIPQGATATWARHKGLTWLHCRQRRTSCALTNFVAEFPVEKSETSSNRKLLTNMKINVYQLLQPSFVTCWRFTANNSGCRRHHAMGAFVSTPRNFSVHLSTIVGKSYCWDSRDWKTSIWGKIKIFSTRNLLCPKFATFCRNSSVSVWKIANFGSVWFLTVYPTNSSDCPDMN